MTVSTVDAHLEGTAATGDSIRGTVHSHQEEVVKRVAGAVYGLAIMLYMGTVSRLRQAVFMHFVQSPKPVFAMVKTSSTGCTAQ